MISQELVRELQKKIDISYEEAEHYLKKSKGNIDMALFLIHKKRHSRWERMKSSVAELMKYKIIITRKEQILINIPVLIFAFLVFIYSVGRNLFPLIVLFVIALVLECEVRVYKEDEEVGNYKESKNEKGSQQNFNNNRNKYNKATNDNNIREANIKEKLARDPNLKRESYSKKIENRHEKTLNNLEKEKSNDIKIHNKEIWDNVDEIVLEKESKNISKDSTIKNNNKIEKFEKEIQSGLNSGLTEEDGFYEITIDK